MRQAGEPIAEGQPGPPASLFDRSASESRQLFPLLALLLAWRLIPAGGPGWAKAAAFDGLVGAGWDIPIAHFVVYFSVALLEVLFSIAIVIVGVRRYGLSNSDLGLCFPPSRWDYVTAALLVVPALAAVYALSAIPDALFFMRLPGVRWEINPAWGAWSNPTAYHHLFTRALVYPFGEELVYRGLVQGVVRRRFGPRAAVFATTAIFAALHPWKGGVNFAAMALAGMLYGGLRERDGSLATPMFAHFAWNQWTTVVAFRAVF